MINRRLLRIKALQELYAYTKSDDKNVALAEKELFYSIEKSYELYFLFLQLATEIRHYAEIRVDLIKNRLLKNDDEWQKIERLANNRIIVQLEGSSSFKNYLKEKKISWVDAEKMIESFYTKIIESDFYQEFTTKESSYENDKDLLEFFYGEVVGEEEYLFEYLEEKSVYWNDDIDYILGMVVKTVRRFKDNDINSSPLFEIFRDSDDKDFIKKLFRSTTVNFTAYEPLIQENLTNWELERVAELDILIIKLAINEAIEFPSIPVKATMNEYIDITKYYSTEKSSTFINGILDKIFKQLQAENKLNKTGRGLLDK